MERKIPSKLYKFQSFENKYSLENLRQREIWFSKPEGLNDPFDCAISVRVTYNDEELMKFITDYYFENLKKEGKSEGIFLLKSQHLQDGIPSEELKKEITSALDVTEQSKMDIYRNLGVACFSTNLTDILMWSHYADGHKGFCLEFDTTYPPFNRPEKLLEVQYDISYPTYPITEITNKSIKLLSPIMTKSTAWRYENEWRCIKKSGNSAIRYHPKALTAIYFGCSASPENMQKILTLPARSAPRIYQMQRSKIKFKLECLPYHT